MEIILLLLCIVALAVSTYSWYEMRKANRELVSMLEAHKKTLYDSGNAITDTLRVAFENLKKHALKQGKIDSKLVEHHNRLHRLEQLANAPKDKPEKPEKPVRNKTTES